MPLSDDEYAVSSDEKTSIQARCRCHPALAPGQARATRVNHEYGCGSASAYLAATMIAAARRIASVRERAYSFAASAS